MSWAFATCVVFSSATFFTLDCRANSIFLPHFLRKIGSILTIEFG